ncbi:MAG: L-aspartate oxidase [Zavarzinella sp.]
MAANRYLTSFDARTAYHQFTDILIIGAGIAGTRAALEIPDSLQVMVLSKDSIRESNSTYAQGGIAGVISPEDTFEKHIEDTHIAGAGLCDPEIVETVIREAPQQINDLIRFGVNFDLENGELALTREGGHSHRRIVHALGDATGHEVMRALIHCVRERPNLVIEGNAFLLDLLTHDGQCVGAIIHKTGIGNVLVWAKAVILTSGGCGMVYRETTNPPIATGDGIAAAYRAGAEVRDMEFMQFHPTVLYVAGSSRTLISEAVRGEGAYLRDVNGERFMLKEDDRAELAPRDVVSQAIFRCMEATRHPNVYLDLSHLPHERVIERFPGIRRACAEFGLDITRDWIPVRPGAHYMVGGVSVDLNARTTIPGLWAAGEVSASGLHGANRLASNSLIEGLVYGTRAATDAVRSCENFPFRLPLPLSHLLSRRTKEQSIDIDDMTNALRSMMVRHMGIVRERKRMQDAHRDVEFWSKYALEQEFHEQRGWELQNLLTVAQLMIQGALAREESRGTHFRADFPKRNDEQWIRHIAMKRSA